MFQFRPSTQNKDTHITKAPTETYREQQEKKQEELSRKVKLFNFFIARTVPRPVPGWGTKATYQVTPYIQK